MNRAAHYGKYCPQFLLSQFLIIAWLWSMLTMAMFSRKSAIIKNVRLTLRRKRSGTSSYKS
jgi:hypothetical protein